MMRTIRTTPLLAMLGLLVPAALATAAAPTDARVTPVFDQPLPNVPGKSMRVVLVDYAPGGKSPAHRHARSAFLYVRVLEGAVRSQVNEGPARVYRAGESFHENPGDRHTVSENASGTEPARLLVVAVMDTAETVLTIPEGTR